MRSWWQRCKMLSSYRKAIPDMLDEEDISEMYASGTKIRERIRELRAEYLAQYQDGASRLIGGEVGVD